MVPAEMADLWKSDRSEVSSKTTNAILPTESAVDGGPDHLLRVGKWASRRGDAVVKLGDGDPEVEAEETATSMRCLLDMAIVDSTRQRETASSGLRDGENLR